MLLAATGGTGKYTQLWGYGYRQAHRLVNQNQEAGKLTPDERLKGSAGNVNHAQHVFGAACTWLEPKAKRASKLEPILSTSFQCLGLRMIFMKYKRLWTRE